MDEPSARPRSCSQRARVSSPLSRRISHPYRTPKIERFPAGRPALPRFALRQPLELGGDFDVVAVGILDHEEEIVAGAVPARSPPDRHVQRGEVIRPATDIVPALDIE